MPDVAFGPGCFFATAPRAGGFPSFLSFGRGSLEKTTQSRIGTLLRSSPPADSAHALTGQTWNPSPDIHSYGAGTAVVVRQGLVEGAGNGTAYQEPATAADSTGLCVLVPGSFISNAEELAERYEDFHPSASPHLDSRSTAAALILRLYARDPDPLLVLSELQGEFSFLLYDAERRTMFAARDASGALPLYYELDEDGGVSVASTPVTVPGDVGLTHWQLLPAGHYVAGRPPRLRQFALTQEQLAERAALEASLEEECVSPHRRGAPHRVTSLDWQSSQQLAF